MDVDLGLDVNGLQRRREEKKKLLFRRQKPKKGAHASHKSVLACAAVAVAHFVLKRKSQGVRMHSYGK